MQFLVSYHKFHAGLGLAVVARIVEQLGGQLRVDSKVGEGSRFSFLIPFGTDVEGTNSEFSDSRSQSISMSRTGSQGAGDSELESLVHAISSSPILNSPRLRRIGQSHESGSSELIETRGAEYSPEKSALGISIGSSQDQDDSLSKSKQESTGSPQRKTAEGGSLVPLRILIVEVIFVDACEVCVSVLTCLLGQRY